MKTPKVLKDMQFTTKELPKVVNACKLINSLSSENWEGKLDGEVNFEIAVSEGVQLERLRLHICE